MKRPLYIEVPEGQKSVRLSFSNGRTAVTVTEGSDGTISTTVAIGTGAAPVVIGDLVSILLEDDEIVSDPLSSESESESLPEVKRAYGIVHRVLETSVLVIWFYARTEFLRPFPQGFASKVATFTLSTKVSTEISKESIATVATVPGMSECVFCVEDNLLKGDAHSILIYYRTLSVVHTHKAETSCTFIEAVEWAITTKQGMFASIGTIRPSQMAETISLFEDTGRARLPHDIGRELNSIGEFPLARW